MAEPDAHNEGVSSFSKRRAAARTARLHAADSAVATMAWRVATARGVTVEQLLQASRGPAELALARQLAMYLAHTLLGRNMAQVGALFGRDRTTVAHACAVIEDRRERSHFDEMVTEIEAGLAGRRTEQEDSRAAG